MSSAQLANADATQAALMNEEFLIRVDKFDNVLGPISKLDAHLVSNDLPLHRAFSVLLFDTENRLLIQQRASTKVTYPNYWANTCCSHPLHNDYELGAPDKPSSSSASVAAAAAAAETAPAPAAQPTSPSQRTPFSPVPPAEQRPVQDPVRGVKRAAMRKLEHELGIPRGTVPEDAMHFMTRVHYRAECRDRVWGEHEMDYVLFAQVEAGAIATSPAENEVRETRWLSQALLRTLFAQAAAAEESAAAENGEGVLVSPWFRIIMDRFGWTWWEQLEARGQKGVLALRYQDKIITDGDRSV